MQDKGYGIRLSELSLAAGMRLRTDGCAMLFCEEGRAIVSLNFERKIIRRRDVVVVFSDTYLNVERVCSRNAVRFLEISAILFDEATFALSVPFWDYLSYNPILFPDSEQKELLDSWVKQMKWIVSAVSSAKHARAMLRSHIGTLFIGLEAALLPLLNDQKTKDTNSVRQILNRFYQLVLKYCRTQHSVRFYAERLCITPYYLSKITRKAMGFAPKDLIDQQIIAEIKHLLISSELSVKEIADEFHFDSGSYLARYFRHRTGMTPREFRDNNELGKRE